MPIFSVPSSTKICCTSPRALRPRYCMSTTLIFSLGYLPVRVAAVSSHWQTWSARLRTHHHMICPTLPPCLLLLISLVHERTHPLERSHIQLISLEITRFNAVEEGSICKLPFTSVTVAIALTMRHYLGPSAEKIVNSPEGRSILALSRHHSNAICLEHICEPR